MLIEDYLLKHMEPKVRSKQIFTIKEIKDTFKQKRGKTKSTIGIFPPFKLEALDNSLTVNTKFFEGVYKLSLDKIKELFSLHTIKDKKEAESSKSNYGKESKGTHWTEKERELFVQCLRKHGKNWEIISQEFPNKTVKQLRNFFQNNKDKLGLSKYLDH